MPPLVGIILGHAINLTNVIFWYLPAEYILFGSLYSLFGGFTSLFVGNIQVNSFVHFRGKILKFGI